MDSLRRTLLLRGILTAATAALYPTFLVPALAAPVKPLIVLFPGAPGPAIQATRGKNDLSGDERSLVATRALRERLDDSGVVTTAVYAPDSPLFLRAAREAKITLARPEAPTEGERISLGKGAGATYVVLVTARDARDDDKAVEIAIEGTDVQTKKSYRDMTRLSESALPNVAPDAPVGDNVKDADPNAVRPVASPPSILSNNILLSAANTLSLRLLGGPLGDFTRTAPRPDLLPPTKPDPATAVATPPAVASSASSPQNPDAISRQAEVLVSAGDISAAISLLRKSISQDPLAMPLRMGLARAYLAARRPTEAISELRRALTLTPSEDRTNQLELTRLLAESLRSNGDTVAAQATYLQIISAQPQAHWARLALADLLVAEGKLEDAEALYRDVRQKDSGNREASAGLARLLSLKGEYESALTELSAATKGNDGGDAASARHTASVTLFEESASRVAALATQNREAWEGKRLSREAFYKATQAQTTRANALVSLLRSVPPPPGSGESLMKAHRRRVLAASLLAQSIASLLSFLESGNSEEGSQASVLLNEFRRELAQARADAAPSPR